MTQGVKTTEIPARVAPTKVIARATVKQLAEAIRAGEGAKEPALQLLAERVIRGRLQDWASGAAVEIQAVTEAAIAKALKDWHKRRSDLERQVTQAAASAHTRHLMDEWAAAIIAQVEGELDEKGLVSTDILEAIHFPRPARKGETAGQATDGLLATDREFFDWWLGELEAFGICTSNRLRLRLLLVALLDVLRGSNSGWRNPTFDSP